MSIERPRQETEKRWRDVDGNDDNEVVSVSMIVMKMSQDDGRQTGMTTGVWLILQSAVYLLPHPEYQRSTVSSCLSIAA